MGMAYFHGSSLPFSQRSQVGKSPKNGKRWKKPREMVDVTLASSRDLTKTWGFLMGRSSIPGLVNVDHHFFYGNINYFYGPSSIAMLSYKRVTNDNIMLFGFAQVYYGISWYIPILWSSQPCKKSTSQYLW